MVFVCYSVEQIHSTEAKFIEAVRDSYLYQYVEHPTRRRGNDDPSRLDLLFTDEAMQNNQIVASLAIV